MCECARVCVGVRCVCVYECIHACTHACVHKRAYKNKLVETTNTLVDMCLTKLLVKNNQSFGYF